MQQNAACLLLFVQNVKFVDGLERETKKEGVTVIYMGCNQGVNKNGGAVWWEGRAKAVNIV